MKGGREGGREEIVENEEKTGLFLVCDLANLLVQNHTD